MRVLIAARLSQLADGQTGLDTQDRESQAWALGAGHEVVHLSADHKSGTTAPWDRPELRPWVTEPELMAQYDAVVAYRLDRLSRGDNESTNAIEKWAHDNGKQLLTVDGLVYPCEGTDGIRWDVTKRIAHQEWLGYSEKYKRMQEYLRSQGALVGRQPYGYAIAGEAKSKTLVIEQTEAEVIRDAAAAYLAGKTLQAICDELNAAGRLPRPYGKGKARRTVYWAPKTLSGALRNPVVYGRREDGDGRCILKVPPILTRDVWQQVTDRMDERATRKGISQSGTPALLTSIISCAVCWGPMYKIMSGGPKNKNRKPYYYCRKGCKSLVSMADADAAAEVYLLQRYGANERTLTRVIPGSAHADEIADVKHDLRDLDPDADDYDERHAGLRAELARLKALPATAPRVITEQTGETVAQYWDRQDAAGRRAMLKGILHAYYSKVQGLWFTETDLTPTEAIKRLAA